MKADGRAQRKERGEEEKGGWVSYIGRGGRVRLIMAWGGTEKERERGRGGGGGRGGEGGGRQSHAQCEKGVVRSCRGGGQRKGRERNGSRRVQRVRRMFSCLFSLEARATALQPSARWLGSHQIKKSLPHQSFTACL